MLEHDLGVIVGVKAPMRSAPAWHGPQARFRVLGRTPSPKRRNPIPRIAPDLAVEFFIKGNTARK